MLTVTCERRNYSASLIARAVEDANAHVLNLNITDAECAPGRIEVSLRISHADPSSVMRSLARYGYATRAESGILSTDGDPADNPFAALQRYLQI